MNTENVSAIGKHAVFIRNNARQREAFGLAPRFAVVKGAENMLLAIHEQILVLHTVQIVADDDELAAFHAGNTGAVISV